MRSYPEGAWVRLTPEASVLLRQPRTPGRVRWSRERGAREIELTVDLEDGGVAVGVSGWFEPCPEAARCPAS